MPDELSWPDVLGSLLERRDLPASLAARVMEEILSGNATSAQIAGFAVALRAKGETVEEVIGMVETMYAHATPLEIAERSVDIVGTGGDRAMTVNISSMAAVVIAGAGARVVKHGNRAASSSSGSADVLEYLGVSLEVAPEKIPDVLEQAGITFCFAPVFHPSYRFTAVPRRELGIPTTFNFLGPLTNPARPAAMAVGVADRKMAPIMAGVFAERGCDALVFRGDDGLDEITTTTTSSVWVADGPGGSVSQTTIDPREFGISLSTADALRGGEVAVNAHVFGRVLDGEVSPIRDAVLLNAAAGLVAHEGIVGELDVRMKTALLRATESIDSGAARRVLDLWIAATQNC